MVNEIMHILFEIKKENIKFMLRMDHSRSIDEDRNSFSSNKDAQ
jgi:hypothetical protein